MAVQAVQEMSLDASEQRGFLSFYRSLSEKPATTFRFFDRNDYYTVHGADAIFAAKEIFKTAGVIKYLGEKKLESVVLSRMNFEAAVRDLLLVRQYRIEVYQNKGSNKNNDWKLFCKASPGNLLQFEDILFGNSEMATRGGVLAVKVAIDNGQKVVGVSFIDNVLYEILVSEFVDNDKFSNLEALVVQLGPKEALVPSGEQNNADYKLVIELLSRSNTLVTERKKSDFTSTNIVQDMNRLLKFKKGEYENSAAVSGMDKQISISCVSATIKYLELLANEENFNLYTFSIFDLSKFVRLDAAAVKALNLFPVAGETAKTQSIYGLLNECRTAQGQRLLSQWIKQPLTDLNLIEERLDIVEMLGDDHNLRNELHSDHLRRFPDFQRLAKKLQRNKAGLQDCYRIYQAVERIPTLRNALESVSGDRVHVMTEAFCEPLKELEERFAKFQEMVETTMDFDQVKNGEYVVKPEFDDRLCELRDKMNELEESIKSIFSDAAKDLNLEAHKSIKLENNSQLGYFMRVTKKEEKHLRNNKSYKMVDSNKAGVRFNNSAMRELNDEFLQSQAEYNQQQKSVVDEIIKIAAGYAEPMQQMNEVIARLDVLLNFAVISANAPTPFVRPKLHSKGTGILKLKEARHPCLEVQEGIHFIPNDVYFEKDKTTFQIITGPNMGGKSTYIRMVGVIVHLAEIGCFVPCETAEISLVDAILARVGAGDSQIKGVSTFMVEMLETAAILRAATSDSLIIIDELGRGTSTYDGFGLAWAISEHIAKKIKAFTLFATHFHELTALSDEIATVTNMHVTALATDDKLTLLYKINPGACDQSFGIHVAELAQFPKHVIEHAKEKLEELEFFQMKVDPLNEGHESIPHKKQKTDKDEAEAIMKDFLGKVRDIPMETMNDEEILARVNKLKEEVISKQNPFIDHLVNRLKI